MQKYEILEHTADLKIKAYGKTLPEIFVNAAQGMASQQLGIENLSEAGQTKGDWEEIAVEADGLESLLLDWLNEILYRSDINEKVYLDFDPPGGGLEFFESPYKIKTKICGLKTRQKKLEIKKTDGGWEATIIFDI